MGFHKGNNKMNVCTKENIWLSIMLKGVVLVVD